MENIQRFIDEINGACDDGQYWVKQSIDDLRTGDPHMTEEELVELDRKLGEIDIPALLEDLYEVHDGGEPRFEVPPIACAAYEWLVGPFIVTHRDYDPYWYRTK